jgi:hypothetical protein
VPGLRTTMHCHALWCLLPPFELNLLPKSGFSHCFFMTWITPICCVTLNYCSNCAAHMPHLVSR